MTVPSAAYTGEPDMPCQMPLTPSTPSIVAGSGALILTMTMSRSGAMPSWRTPSTLPVNCCGVVPEVTDSAVTASPLVGVPEYGVQSGVGATDWAGPVPTVAAPRARPRAAVSETRARPRRWTLVGFI